jgi:hypothetical protein
LRSSWKKWIDEVFPARQKTALAHQMLARLRQRTSTSVLNTWRAWTLEKHVKRGKVRNALNRWRHSAMNSTWASWRFLIEESHRKAEAKRAAQAFRNRCLLLRSLSSLRWNVTRKRLARRAHFHHAKGTILRSFSWWQEWSARHKSLRVIMFTVTKRWASLSLRKSLQSWTIFVADSIRKRELKTLAALHSSRITLHRTLRFWHETCVLQKHACQLW